MSNTVTFNFDKYCYLVCPFRLFRPSRKIRIRYEKQKGELFQFLTGEKENEHLKFTVTSQIRELVSFMNNQTIGNLVCEGKYGSNKTDSERTHTHT